MIAKSQEILGNCKTELPKFHQEFDLVLTSPPYWNQKDCAANGELVSDYNSFEDYAKDMKEIMKLCKEAAKPGAIFAINVGGDPALDLSSWWSMMMYYTLNLNFIDKIAWTRGVSNFRRGVHMTSNNLYYPHLAWEPVYIYRKAPWNGFKDVEFPHFEYRFNDIITTLNHTNVWHIPQDNEAPWHPAPFPRKLAYNLIACYTEPGAAILDPFAGAFTVAVATNDVGGKRTSVCIEIDPDRYEKGRERIATNNQIGMF